MPHFVGFTNGPIKPGPGKTMVTFVDAKDEKPPAEPPKHEFNQRTLFCDWCDIAKKDAVMHRLTRCEGPFRQAALNGCEVVPADYGDWSSGDGSWPTTQAWWDEVRRRWPEQAAKAEADNSRDDS